MIIICKTYLRNEIDAHSYHILLQPLRTLGISFHKVAVYLPVDTEIQHQQVKPLINAGTGAPSIHWDGGYKPGVLTLLITPSQIAQLCLLHASLLQSLGRLIMSVPTTTDTAQMCSVIRSGRLGSFLIFTQCPISCIHHVKTQLTKMTCISLSVYKQTSEARQQDKYPNSGSEFVQINEDLNYSIPNQNYSILIKIEKDECFLLDWFFPFLRNKEDE